MHVSAYLCSDTPVSTTGILQTLKNKVNVNYIIYEPQHTHTQIWAESFLVTLRKS